MKDQSLLEQLRRGILDGEFIRDGKVRSERRLAVDFGCSKTKVHEALRRLVDGGLLVSRPGSGYAPAPVAPGGATRCILIRNSNKPVMPYPGKGVGGLVSAILRKAGGAGVSVERRNACGEELATLLESIPDSGRYDAILFEPDLYLTWNRGFGRVMERNFPLLFLDMSLFGGIFPTVAVNTFELGFRAAVLLGKRCRKPLFVGYPANRGPHCRLDGFREGCALCGLAPGFEFCAEREDAAAEKRLAPLLARIPGEFDGVFASTSFFTRCLIRCLVRANRIPGRGFHFIGEGIHPPVPGQTFQPDVFFRNDDLMAERILEQVRRREFEERIILRAEFHKGIGV